MFINKWFLVQISALIPIMLATQARGAQTSSESKRIEELERAVAELRQEVARLKKEAAPAPEGKMKAMATYDGKKYVEKAVVQEEKAPIYVQQRGPELKLVLGGFIQTNYEVGDVSAFEGRFGESELNDRFRLRRARINLTGDFAEQFDFKVEGDFGNSDGLNSSRTAFSGTDIFINWHQYPEAQIKVGQWKAPYGLEQLTPDTVLYLTERSLPTGAITPDRQIGVQLWGKPFTNVWPEQKDLLTYYAGIFNGNGRNITNNDNNQFMYVGRLELMPFKGKVFGQESFLKLAGDVFTSRDAAGTTISSTANLLVNDDGSLSPFNLPSPDERTAWGVDAWLKLGPFDLIGEFLQARVRPRGAEPEFSKFTTDGYYITGGYFLIPKKLQLAVRWEHLNPGQKGNDGISSITGGLNYYIRGDDLKLMINYIHTWSDFREANPEFGQDQFNEVIARAQLMF